MDEKNMRYYSLLSSIHRNIQYYKKMILLSSNPFQKRYFEGLLNNERNRLNYLRNYFYHNQNRLNQREQPEQRVFTIQELAQFDGSNGKPAYVAVNGIVYDVSFESTWGGGTHFSLYAGRDLTAQFNGCHGGMEEILRNLPEVGILKD